MVFEKSASPPGGHGRASADAFLNDKGSKDDAPLKIEGLTIDLFHTLVAVEDVQNGRPRTHQLLNIPEAAFKRSWDPHVELMCLGKGQGMFQSYAEVCRENGLLVDEARIREVVTERARRFEKLLLNPREEVLAALRTLRKQGLRLALLSNAMNEDIHGWMKSPFRDCFDAVVFSCWEGVMKPDAEIYYRALECIHVPAKRCLHVGDGGNDEYIGAREVGYLGSIGVMEYRRRLWPDTVDEKSSQANFVVETFMEVPALVEKLQKKGVPQTASKRA